MSAKMVRESTPPTPKAPPTQLYRGGGRDCHSHGPFTTVPGAAPDCEGLPGLGSHVLRRVGPVHLLNTSYVPSTMLGARNTRSLQSNSPGRGTQSQGWRGGGGGGGGGGWRGAWDRSGALLWLSVSHSPGWLKAVQALMVLSLVLCCLSFILFMFQLYNMKRGGLFYATGLCQLCTSVSVFTGALIYAIHVKEFHQADGSFGYCFALAWVAFPLALASGIIYIHLRKRE
uniref:Epithelial membrane protein 3 n=2 Tax=Vombatus ursinus TaxID=29139 RepID=A0A4X2KXU4_VOMUR